MRAHLTLCLVIQAIKSIEAICHWQNYTLKVDVCINSAAQNPLQSQYWNKVIIFMEMMRTMMTTSTTTIFVLLLLLLITNKSNKYNDTYEDRNDYDKIVFMSVLNFCWRKAYHTRIVPKRSAAELNCICPNVLLHKFTRWFWNCIVLRDEVQGHSAASTSQRRYSFNRNPKNKPLTFILYTVSPVSILKKKDRYKICLSKCIYRRCHTEAKDPDFSYPLNCCLSSIIPLKIL